jgi:RNA-directed DNA polymerase
MTTVQMQMELGKAATGPRDRSRDELIAARLAESPTGEPRLMEAICERENRREALKRVEQNKGAPGVDGMKTGQLRGYLRRHWEQIKEALLNGTHKPMPVRRAEIEKEGGVCGSYATPTMWPYTYGQPRRRNG